MNTSLIDEIPDIKPFLVTPVDARCVQGAVKYDATLLACRDGVVFFLDPETGQYGVGSLVAREIQARPSIGDATQYPTLSTAYRMFVTPDRDNVDPFDEIA